jgi:arginyl-tRNA synthetase
VKLASLLDEAIERAEAVVLEKDPNLETAERKIVAKKVGIGAVKYSDLSKTRTHDYIFSWDSMLSFEGNTAPYLQYAYTRIRSIQRKAAEAGTIAGNATNILIQAEQERALALKCLQFEEALQQVAQDAYPHVLCTYLYDLSSLFMAFYESCPILKPEIGADVRSSRLSLCEAVAGTLACGLDLLGIEVMERM